MNTPAPTDQYLADKVATASSLQLVVMVYDVAPGALRAAMAATEVDAVRRHLRRTQEVLRALQASPDRLPGGDRGRCRAAGSGGRHGRG